MRRITVAGFDGTPLTLPPASLLVGGKRHLAHVDSAAERVVLGPLKPALERIAAHDGDVVVIASGDPGFFGIVRALREMGEDPVVRPAVSSVALAFARAGLPWDDAIVVSAHGRSLRRAANVCRAHPKVAVLTAPGSGPAELASLLAGVPRQFVIASRLGHADEQVSTLDAAGAMNQTWPDPNVVLCLRHPDKDGVPGWVAGWQPSATGWAKRESAYVHRDSMITKAEVRALVIAKLGPRLGDLIWDVGAGSGSVAAECATHGAAVIAIDHDPEAAGFIAANAPSAQIVLGQAPDCLEALPEPDAVFIGGGGLTVLTACLQREPARIVLALAAIDRVTAAVAQLEQAGYGVEAVQLQASRLKPLPDGSLRLAAVNPVFVVSGEAL